MKNFFKGVLLSIIVVTMYNFIIPEYDLEIKTMTVAPGDTVWGLASYCMNEQDKHHDVRGMEYDILKANKLSYNSYLQPGQTIYIPLYKKVE